GPMVHAVLVRDASVVNAVREWHQQANPGPLLLLPLDADWAGAEDSAGDALASRVDAAPTARAWVRALVGRVRSLGEGESFVDARGAVWLPGAGAGSGPLRRRAELWALRSDLTATGAAREAAGVAAEAVRERLRAAEQELVAADERVAHAQRTAHDAAERQAQLERRVQRLERELDDAASLATRLKERSDALRERLHSLTRDHAAIAELLGGREPEGSRARQQLT